MKTKLLIFSIIIHFNCLNLSSAQTPSWVWAKSEGGSNYEFVPYITNDLAGNLIATGNFASPTINFGSTTLVNHSNAGFTDIYIVKYSPTGSVIWAKSAGGIRNDDPAAIATDASGNLIIVGYFESPSLTFDNITLLNPNTGRDLFVVKYDSTGTVLWAKSAGGIGNDVANSVSIDAFGNIIVAGYFSCPTIALGSTTLTNSSNAGLSDIFIAKFDQSGISLWAISAGGSNGDGANSITIDKSGNIIVVGYFESSTISFNSITLTNSYAGTEMFIAKLDTSGTFLWASSAVGNYYDAATSVACDSDGNIIVVGYFYSSSISFGNTVLTNSNVNNSDMFIVKYDASGNFIRANSYGGFANDDNPFSVVTDAFGNFVVVGYFYSSTLAFGNTILSNAGYVDMFISKFDTSGNVLWAKSTGGSGHDFATSVSIDSWGNTFVAGYFESPSISFGAISVINSGSYDMFIAKLDNSTGINDMNEFCKFEINPNPFESQTTINFKYEQINSNVQLFDIIGNEIKAINFTGNQYILEKRNIQPGIYFLHVSNRKNNIASKILIIE